MTTTLDVINKCLSETPSAFCLNNKTVVLTGQSETLPRDDLTILLQNHGARISGNVSYKTDYLIVCSGKSDGWINEAYGKKLEKAIEIKEAGGDIQIVNDQFVISFLMNNQPPKFNSFSIQEVINKAFNNNSFNELEMNILHVIASNVKDR